MISPKQMHLVIDMMSHLGYQMGNLNWGTGEINPIDRETMMIYKLNPDHLPHFILANDDSAIRLVLVDFANSLTWTRSPFNVPIDSALEEIVYQPIPGIYNIQMPCFNLKYQFIFTILHLFREAWVFREGWTDTLYKGWESDVSLSKFTDIILLWKKFKTELDIADFIETIENFQIVDPILWVLVHTDHTFNTSIVSTLDLENRVTKEWLQSSGGVGGKRIEWKGTMRERLYCKNRRQLFLK
jgi:hypothetical protein